MTKKIVVEQTQMVIFEETELSTQKFGTWDDNGDWPDGDLFLLPLADVTPFEGMEIVKGFIVHAYCGNANYSDFCGFSSRDVAYTTSRETAEAIASDEFGTRAAG